MLMKKVNISKKNGRLLINGDRIYLYIDKTPSAPCYFCEEKMSGKTYSFFFDSSSYFSSIRYFCESCYEKMEFLVNV